jgi:hypothetical protein
MTGVLLAVAAIVVALAFGGFRALTDGRFRGTHAVRGADAPHGGPPANHEEEQVGVADEPEESAWTQVGAAAAGTELGERATLVQFSSAFCAPCRATRRVLSDVAGGVPGVVHLEIDAEHHLDVVRRLGILRTPTTLVLDPRGREVARAAGAPRKEQVLAAIPAADLA